MMTTTNTTVFKRMGRILSLVFSDYNEARAFREAFLRLVTYAVLFIIKLAISMAIGIISLPICIAVSLYRIVKMGAALVNCNYMN